MEEKGLKISDGLIIGFDMATGKDEVALTVTRSVGKKYCIVRAINGQEAIDLYEKLTGEEVPQNKVKMDSKIERGNKK